MKVVLEQVYQLNYISSVENSDEIVFPRVKRRRLEAKDETDDMLKVPKIEELEKTMQDAKMDAIDFAKV